MAKRIRSYRKWAEVAFVPNGQATIDLPLGLDLESISFYFAGLINTTVAWTGVKSEGISRLMKRVELIANGQSICSTTGEFLSAGNFARGAGVIKLNPLASVGVQDTESVSFLDQSFIGGRRPADSNLRTKGFRTLQLRITWGNFSDVFTGAGTTVATTLSLGVSVRETKEFVDTTGFSLNPELRRLHRFTEKTYPSTTQDRIMLDPNVMYKAIVLRAENGTDVTAGIITNVKIQLGNEIVIDMAAHVIRDVNAQDYGIGQNVGFYVIDFAPSPSGLSKVTNFLDTYGRNGDAFLILDVVGGVSNKVQIMSHQFEWLNDAVAENQLHARQLTERQG